MKKHCSIIARPHPREFAGNGGKETCTIAAVKGREVDCFLPGNTGNSILCALFVIVLLAFSGCLNKPVPLTHHIDFGTWNVFKERFLLELIMNSSVRPEDSVYYQDIPSPTNDSITLARIDELQDSIAIADSLLRVYASPPESLHTYTGTSRDSVLKAVQYQSYKLKHQLNLNYSFLAATLSDTILLSTFALNKPPSDDFYLHLLNRVDTLHKIYTSSQSDPSLQPAPASGEIPYEVKTELGTGNPWGELLETRPTLDTMSKLVPRLNGLFNRKKYRELITLLRSNDVVRSGPVRYHVLGSLFLQYAVIDSSLFMDQESEILRAIEQRQTRLTDSLIQRLDQDTFFLFPNRVNAKKRILFDSLVAWKKIKPKQTEQGDFLVDSKSPSFFWCHYNNSIHLSDLPFAFEDEKTWLSLSPSSHHLCRELVTKSVFSYKKYEDLHPGELPNEYTDSGATIFVNASDSGLQDSTPIVFFNKIPGITAGEVEKAEVYQLLNQFDLAVIENDYILMRRSCEYRSRFPTERFIGAEVRDTTSYYSNYLSSSAYHLWYGDVNRNGCIDIIEELYGTEYGNHFFFMEKQSRNGKCYIDIKMHHNQWTYD